MLFFVQNNKNALLIFALLSVCELSLAADEMVYGVMYPTSHGPYQAVFKSVIAGIESKMDGTVDKIAINDSADLGKVQDWVKGNKITILVSLGNQGLELCSGLSNQVQLVAGAILSPPEDGCQIRNGIALAPHPDKLFEWLQRLKPEIKTVYVVYNPEFNAWLIDHAFEAAKAKNITLVTHQAASLDQAAKHYLQIMDSRPGAGDAVWLPQDPYTVDEKTILPTLLKESWNRGFVVFSSNAAHVKRGVLFGLYPDFEAMGVSLGLMAGQVEPGDSIKNSSIQPLTDVLIAVNLRTADHLKLDLKSNERDAFNLTFPALR
jgi:putative ABC transport system substrate-binding protein